MNTFRLAAPVALGVFAVAAVVWLVSPPARPPIPAPTPATEVSAATPSNPVVEPGVTREAGATAAGGRLLDERGEPIVGVTIEAKSVFPPRQSLTARTGPDGAFAFAGAPAPGDFALEIAASEGCALHPPQREVWLPCAEALELRATRFPVLHGVVRDASGAPVARAEITLLRAGYPLGSAKTDARGVFAATPRGVSVDPVDVTVVTPDATGAVDAGSFGFVDPVEITLPAPQRLHIVVRETDSNSPVERFGVRLRPIACRLPGIDRLRFSATHARGELTIEPLWPGEVFIRVVPEDPLVAPSGVLRVDPGALGDAPFRVHLARRTPLRVRVTWRGGQPAVGLPVVAIGGNTERLRGHVFDPLRGPLEPMQRWQLRMPTVLSRSQTDTAGEAILSLPAEKPGCTVRVELDENQRDDRVVDGSTDLVAIRLDRPVPTPGRIFGTVRHAYEPGTRVMLALDHRPVPLETDGSYSVVLDPGRVFPVVTVEDLAGAEVGKHSVPLIDLEPGTEVERNVDCPALGGVRGRVTIDGAPGVGRVRLLRSNLKDAGRAAPLDASGSYAFDDVWPGEYVIRVEPADGKPIWDPERTRRVKSGESLRADLVFTLRRVVIRAVDSRGVPAARARLVVAMGPVAEWVTTDELGVGIVERIPNSGRLGMYDNPEKSVQLGGVVLEPECAEYVVDVTMR